MHTITSTYLLASTLTYAQPLLQDNITLVLMVILFAVADLLAFHPKGVMQCQLANLGNMRNARTFESSAGTYPWLQPLLLCQYFLFFGLCILKIADAQMAQHLACFDFETLTLLVLSLAFPVLWYVLHLALINWFCYLFGMQDHQIIINRCYRAIHILLSPLSLLTFSTVLAGAYSTQVTLFLLVTLFILSQIAFIFCAFKIFCSNLYGFLLIIAYLCTLEIAPLMVIYAKIFG